MTLEDDEDGDDDGNETRGRACESGWCVHDSLRKVPTLGHIRDVELVTARDYTSDMPLELSVGYHTLTSSFARFPSCLRTTGPSVSPPH